MLETANELDQLLETEYQHLELGEEIPKELSLAISDKVTKTRAGVCDISNYMVWNKGQVNIMKEKIKSLQSAVKSYENRQSRMKHFVKLLLEKFNTSKIQGDEGASFSFRKSSTCEIFDADKIPAEYITYTRTINKSAVKAAINRGDFIEGAKIVENKNVNIK
jgi:hypothetical protein